MPYTDFKCIDCGNTTCISIPKNNHILQLRVQHGLVCCNCQSNAEAQHLGITRAEYNEYLINKIKDDTMCEPTLEDMRKEIINRICVTETELNRIKKFLLNCGEKLWRDLKMYQNRKSIEFYSKDNDWLNSKNKPTISINCFIKKYSHLACKSEPNVNRICELEQKVKALESKLCKTKQPCINLGKTYIRIDNNLEQLKCIALANGCEEFNLSSLYNSSNIFYIDKNLEFMNTEIINNDMTEIFLNKKGTKFVAKQHKPNKWKPKHQELVECWDNSYTHIRTLRFYDKKNKCTYSFSGECNGSNYDNYSPITGPEPKWATKARKTLKDC